MNKLLYLSGNDIPFVQAQINIHQPKLKEIAFLGEEHFYLGCNLLCFSIDKLSEEDKVNLKNKTNFDVLMSIVNSKQNTVIQKSILSLQLLMSLLFPQHTLMIMPNMFVLTKQDEEGNKEQSLINQDNFEIFKNIIEQMFCLKTMGGDGDYNPANKLAQQIAKKFKDRHKKLSRKQGDTDKELDILSRYISILVLGNRHTFTELMQYTVFQLFDQFRRFQKKYSYDVWFQAKLAGAENLEDVDNWMSDEQETIPRPSSNRIEF